MGVLIETEQKLPCWFLFNSQNLDATLQNIHCFCPSISTMLINTYRISIELFIDGEVIYSREGTTKDLWQCQCMSLQLSHCSRVSLNLSLRYGTLTMRLPWAWALSQIFVIGGTNLLTWTPALAIIPTQLRHGWLQRIPASQMPLLLLPVPTLTSPALDDHIWVSLSGADPGYF